MTNENRNHVIGLSVRNQLTLRLLLNNLLSGFIKKQLIELKQRPDADMLALKTALTQKALEDFNALTNLLANPENAAKSKSKMLKISPRYMRHLVLAVQGFNPDENELNFKDLRYVTDGFDGLASIIEQSAMYTYTDLEIDTILDRKK